MRTKKLSKKRLVSIILTLAILVAIGIGVTTLLPQSDKNKDNKITNSNQRENDKKPGKTDKPKPTNDNPDDTAPESEKKIQPQYEGENVNKSQSLTGVINSKLVVGANLIIRTTINQALGSGDCNLFLKNNDKTVTRSSSIIQNPSSSTCEGFDIPLSELGSGNWKIEIQIKSGNKTGTLIDNITL